MQIQKPGFLSSLDKKDPIYKKLKKQKSKRGFDDSEIWNLDETIAILLIPRIKRFIEINKSQPENSKLEDLNFKLSFILKSFEDYYMYKQNQESYFYKDNLKKSLSMLKDIWFDLKC